jgi:segregation and condensation protein B
VPELIDSDKLKQILEAALMAADAPLTIDNLTKLFAHGELDSAEGRAQIRDTLAALEVDTRGRGYELVRVASGYRYQVRQELSEWVSRLWDEKPPRYTRALLETLALIVYKQPVTRGDIEEVRGVAVSQNIMRTLVERGWIRVVGQREAPGKPSLYGTTRAFLDYFSLKSLDQLPPLAEIRSLIEPLVIEEVIQEAREVVERDHPELAAVDGGNEPLDEAAAERNDERSERQERQDGSRGQEREHGEGQGRHDGQSDEETFVEDVADSVAIADEIGDEVKVADEVESESAEGVGQSAEDFADGERSDEDDAADGEDDAADGEAGERARHETPTAEVVRLPLPPRR